ncbi:LPXTG cell wall anchor domain-containing protein [Vagococcus sp. JNUCC 83]
MKKIVMFLLLCLTITTGSLKGIAADGGNIEVEGKIIFYDSSSSQENPKKEEPKKDKPTASSSKKNEKKGILPKTGENNNQVLFSSGFILISIFLLVFVLRREGAKNETTE